MIDPRRLLTFGEVARQRSFSHAARALSLTQPAVSQQIRALEQQLGERLIRRGRGGFALTPAGELLAAHADALAARLALADTQLREATAEGARRLRVGAFPSVLATVVPAAIAAVRRDVDGLEVSAVQGTTEELVAGVGTGRFHLAFCFQDAGLPRREHPETDRHDLLEEPMLAAVGPDHRLAHRRRVRLAELADETWTTPSAEGLIRRACVAADFEPRVAFLTSDPLAIRALVAAGLAVTLVPQLLAGHLHGVAVIPLSGRAPRRAIYAVAPSRVVHPLVAPFLAAARVKPATSGARARRAPRTTAGRASESSNWYSTST
jgi:DNA-binding transcriptional LysR family regulator